MRTRPPELRFERLPFDHPLFILFSSGTTGAPKCIVHGAGAVLAKIGVEPRGTPADQATAFTQAEYEKWKKVIVEGKIKL